jgi:hypothetical protein
MDPRQNKTKMLLHSATAFNVFFYVTMVSISLSYLIIVNEHLWNAYATTFKGPNVGGTIVYGTCYLQSNFTSHYMCNYAYTLPSLNMLFILIMSCLMCTGGKSAIYTNVAFSTMTFIWWIFGASLMTDSIVEANAQHVPQEYWRNVILGLGWGQVLVSLLSVLCSSYMVSLKDKLLMQEASQTLPVSHPATARGEGLSSA